jgi:hypothetical protein
LSLGVLAKADVQALSALHASQRCLTRCCVQRELARGRRFDTMAPVSLLRVFRSLASGLPWQVPQVFV